jgi:tRNA(fMet)-specific endonuclease VapC
VTTLVLDTNAYSGYLRGNAPAVNILRTAHEIHLPLIVLAELLAGFAAGARLMENRGELARFMSSPRVHLLKPDEKTAQHYADVYAALRAQGTPIPTNDLWIAALARQHRMPLMSFDAHFSLVPGLELVVEPEAPPPFKGRFPMSERLIGKAKRGGRS